LFKVFIWFLPVFFHARTSPPSTARTGCSQGQQGGGQGGRRGTRTYRATRPRNPPALRRSDRDWQGRQQGDDGEGPEQSRQSGDFGGPPQAEHQDAAEQDLDDNPTGCHRREARRTTSFFRPENKPSIVRGRKEFLCRWRMKTKKTTPPNAKRGGRLNQPICGTWIFDVGQLRQSTRLTSTRRTRHCRAGYQAIQPGGGQEISRGTPMPASKQERLDDIATGGPQE